MLCPFHYFGITDLSIVGDDKDNRNFSMLTSDERVKHIIRQANYYGYSGEKVKGIIFCSSIKETQELSHKFNNIVFFYQLNITKISIINRCKFSFLTYFIKMHCRCTWNNPSTFHYVSTYIIFIVSSIP